MSLISHSNDNEMPIVYSNILQIMQMLYEIQ